MIESRSNPPRPVGLTALTTTESIAWLAILTVSGLVAVSGVIQIATWVKSAIAWIAS